MGGDGHRGLIRNDSIKEAVERKTQERNEQRRRNIEQQVLCMQPAHDRYW